MEFWPHVQVVYCMHLHCTQLHQKPNCFGAVRAHIALTATFSFCWCHGPALYSDSMPYGDCTDCKM